MRPKIKRKIKGENSTLKRKVFKKEKGTFLVEFYGQCGGELEGL